VPMVDSNFVKPLRMIFCLNGRERKWDLVRVHRSVAIILFNTTNKKMIFVKQFRPGILFTLNCIQESLFIKTCSIESCLLQFNP